MDASRLSFVGLLLIGLAVRADDVAPVYKGRTLNQWAEYLDPNNRKERYGACNAFRDFGPGPVHAVPKLIELLAEDDARFSAIIALGKYGPAARGARQALTRLLGHDDSLVRKLAAEALIQIVTDQRDQLTRDLLTRFSDSGRASGRFAGAVPNLTPVADVAVPQLIAMLQSPDAHSRDVALSAVTDLGPAAKDAVPALTGLLKTMPEGRDRWFVANILGHIGLGAKAALPEIDALATRSNVASERQRAAVIAGRIDPSRRPAAVEMLKGLLAQRNEAGRLAFGNAGGYSLGWPELLPALAREVNDVANPATSIAIAAIVDSGKPAVPFLVEVLGGTNSKAREPALIGLGKLGPTAADGWKPMLKLLKNADPWVTNVTVQALAAGGPAAVPVLIEAAQGGDDAIAVGAIATLGSINPAPTQSVPVLIGILNGKSLERAGSAVSSLGEMGIAARPAVAALRKRLDKTWDGLAVARALAKIDDTTGPEVAPVMMEFLRSRQALLRYQAACDLGLVPAAARAFEAEISAVHERETDGAARAEIAQLLDTIKNHKSR